MTMLAERIAKYTRPAAPRPVVDERPGCAYGAITRQSVQDLRDQTGRIESKINAILGGIGIAIVVQILLGLAK